MGKADSELFHRVVGEMCFMISLVVRDILSIKTFKICSKLFTLVVR